MNLSSANRDALGEGSVGIAASVSACTPNRPLTRGPGAAENDKKQERTCSSPGGFMLCEAASARSFTLMGCLTAAHFPVHMRAQWRLAERNPAPFYFCGVSCPERSTVKAAGALQKFPVNSLRARLAYVIFSHSVKKTHFYGGKLHWGLAWCPSASFLPRELASTKNA